MKFMMSKNIQVDYNNIPKRETRMKKKVELTEKYDIRSIMPSYKNSHFTRNF